MPDGTPHAFLSPILTTHRPGSSPLPTQLTSPAQHLLPIFDPLSKAPIAISLHGSLAGLPARRLAGRSVPLRSAPSVDARGPRRRSPSRQALTGEKLWLHGKRTRGAAISQSEECRRVAESLVRQVWQRRSEVVRWRRFDKASTLSSTAERCSDTTSVVVEGETHLIE